ncbi:MAG: type II toxin-antitoxin system VapC family toxin [Muribaculaceae bacterium]|nr:type II toxin-antitoxin system VapC family toxin [Muribaculaceae bacterium]
MKRTRYLLDTSICVFLMRGKFNLYRKLEEIGLRNCCISEITVAELLFGAVWSGDPDNLNLTKNFCKEFEVIPIYGSLMDYANQKSSLRSQGLTVDDFDLLIGCSAMANNLTLVTDNVKHFNHLPIRIENWVKR